MRKSILHIGKTLSRAKQRQINGGSICDLPGIRCFSSGICNPQNCSGSLEYCECGACIDITVELEESVC